MNHPTMKITLDGLQQNIDHIANVPDDVLTTIFAWCFGESGDEENLHQLKACWAPLLMCGVCRRWRLLAISTPTLWSAIQIVPLWDLAVPDPQLVDLFLQRSRSCPLSLKLIAMSEPVLRSSKRYLENIFDLFVTQIHRWRHVTLFMTDPLVERMESTVTTTALLLERLKIETLYCKQNAASNLASSFPLMPRLRTLSWTSFVPGLPSLTWKQMTNIHLSCPISIGDCVSYLSDCQAVEEVSMQHVTDVFDSSWTNSPSVTLLHLSRLRLRFLDCNLQTFLDHFTLPSLRLLRIQLIGGTNSSRLDSDSLENFLIRSACPLNRLRISGTFLPEEEVLKILIIPYLQTVNYVEIRSSCIKEEFCDRLKRLDMYPITSRLLFCPPQTLSLSCFSAQNDISSTAVDSLRSR